MNTHNLDEAQRICDKIGILNTTLRVVGTPDYLEKAIKGLKTVITLEQTNDKILNSLKKLPLKNFEQKNHTLSFDVTDPDSENWKVVEAIVLAGGHVTTVDVVGSSLEDVYLKLVRESQ